MRDQESLNAPDNKLAEGQKSMDDLWTEAASKFKAICGESLEKGDVKTFDDVRKKIESTSEASYNTKDGDDKDKWDKAKGFGLKSLKYVKMLVGVASQASGFIPIPGAATNMTCSALCFVFDIPQAIKGYNDAIDQVFGEVSSALDQFKIYKSMETIDPLLIHQIYRVMIKFVEICAHVVKYRQGHKLDRFFKQMKSIFDDDSGLSQAMADFRQALQQQRDVEGTLTLAVMVDTRKDLTKRLEDLSKKADDTQMGVQVIKDEVDRTKMLKKIRDTLGVWVTVHLDTNTTQTVQNIAAKCLEGTGKWIDTHEAYTSWTGPKDKRLSHVLLVSGPPSSGKTSAAALIIKRLEQKKDRTYAAHYFFPASTSPANTRRSEGERTTVQSALKYMAFQIARVDSTVRKALSKACDSGFLGGSSSSSTTSLESLWSELKIGGPGSGTTYYLVFDGIENLPRKQVEMLLKFLFSPKLTGESMGRVRVLVSGTEEIFNNEPTLKDVLRIQMQDHNEQDMRMIVEGKLNEGTTLSQHPKLNTDHRKARDNIIEKLPQKVKGSYSQLQFELDDVFRMLSTRTALKDLDKMLDRPMSSHELAIKKLQQSLTVDEIGELNELLKWVLFSRDASMSLSELEAVMFLYSDTESLASLQDIIKAKYSAVLKIEDGYVYAEEGVREQLQKGKDISVQSSHLAERPTISMTIKINNVDQEVCGHFFWDLAQKAIRDKFKFEFDASSNALHSSRATIVVDELDAHRTIVMRAFEFLEQEPRDQTEAVSGYLFCWLPHHLNRLRKLEEEDKGSLTRDEKLQVGRYLYNLFKDDEVFRRHSAHLQEGLWWVEDMDWVQEWMHDPTVGSQLDKQWRGQVKMAVNPTRGYLRAWVKSILEGFLRERTWGADDAVDWIREFMDMDNRQSPDANTDTDADADADDASSSKAWAKSTTKIDWDDLSKWCQRYLGLADSNLDSLWYERLAEAAASSQDTGADVVLSLYKRAIDARDPSWMCHRGLGKTYFDQDRTSEAIAELEVALKGAERDGATPEPKEKDITDLHLLLGDYNYADRAMNAQKAAEHYLFACKRGDAEQSRKGQLGRLKAMLRCPNEDETRNYLQDALAQKGEEGGMVSILKLVALDEDNGAIFSKMFTVAKEHPDLLKGIVHATETATAPAPGGARIDELDEEKRFEQKISLGVLLYYRGVAAYTYKVSPEGTEPVKEALRLWEECREQLADFGGSNSSLIRKAAITDLAKHYFQTMVEEQNLDYVDELTKLASDPNSNDDPAGLLGALYALRGEWQQSKAVLRQWIRMALQILSDDTPDNDDWGFGMLYTTLAEHQDLRNAIIALSLYGQPHLVTETLFFNAQDIVGDDVEDKEAVLDMVTKLAKETIQRTRSQVPDLFQHSQRIKVAKEHVESLLAATRIQNNAVPESEEGDKSQATSSEGRGKDEPAVRDPTTSAAYRLLHSRLSALEQSYTPKANLNSDFGWSCDGRTSDGKRCDKEVLFGNGFYHCVYCTSRDFCEDCLGRLRDPRSCTEITACSAKHRWLKIPPLGQDRYARLWPEVARVPSDVRSVKGDERIFEVHYAADGEGQEVTVEAWKQALADEWGIVLEHKEGEKAG